VKKITLALFIFGLVLDCAAFLGYYADQVPMLNNILNSSAIMASHGIDFLVARQELNQGEPGFAELERIFFDNLPAEQRAESAKLKLAVTKFHALGFFGQRIGQDGTHEEYPIVIDVTQGRHAQWELDHFKTLITEGKNRSIFRYSLSVFCVGTLLLIVGQVIDRCPPTRHS